jgi:hypothetical protein
MVEVVDLTCSDSENDDIQTMVCGSHEGPEAMEVAEWDPTEPPARPDGRGTKRPLEEAEGGVGQLVASQRSAPTGSSKLKIRKRDSGASRPSASPKVDGEQQGSRSKFAWINTMLVRVMLHLFISSGQDASVVHELVFGAAPDMSAILIEETLARQISDKKDRARNTLRLTDIVYEGDKRPWVAGHIRLMVRFMQKIWDDEKKSPYMKGFPWALLQRMLKEESSYLSRSSSVDGLREAWNKKIVPQLREAQIPEDRMPDPAIVIPLVRKSMNLKLDPTDFELASFRATYQWDENEELSLEPSPEQRARWSAANSTNITKAWASKDKDERAAWRQNISDGVKTAWAHKDPDARAAWGKRIADGLNSRSPEEKAAWRAAISAGLNSRSPEEKAAWRAAISNGLNSRSPEEKAAWRAAISDGLKSRSEDEKARGARPSPPASTPDRPRRRRPGARPSRRGSKGPGQRRILMSERHGARPSQTA